jgi:hypothetical protein
MMRALRRRYGHAESRNAARRAIRPGLQGMATRIEDAYQRLAEVIATSGGISEEAARRVIRVYEKHRVLNKKGAYSTGVISVKHGGFLDRDTILRALAEAHKSGL